MISRPVRHTLLAACLLAGFGYAVALTLPEPPLPLAEQYASLPSTGAVELKRGETPTARGDDARGRMAFELARLRDPRTGEIPADMRARELAFAAGLPVRDEGLGKNSLYAATWSVRGPHNVGGRTRALAIDLGYNGTTNRRILAGGVSGGVFVSEDDGASWQFTSSLAALASVTAIAQDPNNRDVWYHGTGEFQGSAGPFGRHIGQGLFKSTNGGRTWTPLPGSSGTNRPTVFDDPLDYIWNVVVHPQGSVVIAASIAGISRSTDGGQTWRMTLGALQNPLSQMTDVAIGANGHVYATLSRNGGNVAQHGVFRSTDAGLTWTRISPPDLAADPYRMVIGPSPSDPNTVYVLTQANAEGSKAADHQLFRFNAAGNTWTNLSANLPNVTQANGQGQPALSGNASFTTQGGYDILVQVKPDNPNVVWIGGTVLYRSTNGGGSFERIGGYSDPYTYAQFDNHHSDQHALVFFPGNASAFLSGHDGGISKATNALQSPQQWTALNNGYVTSQFYAVAQDPNGGNDLLLGGTQDNGTWLTTNTGVADPWVQRLSGDGAFAAVAPGLSALYVSSQNASVLRVRPVNNQLSYSLISPASLTAPLFIAPLLLDPNDSRVMYLAGANTVWRNGNLDGIAEGNTQPTDQNWTQLTGSAVGTAQSHWVTAVAVSKTPANRLYFGATNYQTDTKLVRVDNPAGNGAGTAITPPVEAGSYPSGIGVHPDNGDEVMAVFSNYNVKSVWHTTNGGQSWTNVEGNLSGEDGPSVRWAAIQPAAGGTAYLLATSTGVYSTTALAGAGTTWVQEGATTIGNVPTNMVIARADGNVVAATHGRGVYSAKLATGGGQAQASLSATQVNVTARPGQTGRATVSLNNVGGGPLQFTAQATCSVAGTAGAVAGDGSPVLSTFVTNPRRLRRSDAPSPPSARAVPNTGRAGPEAARAAGTSARSMPGTVLTLDDGNAAPDNFIGNPGNVFSWYNRFDVTGTPFALEEVQWYMQTGGRSSNTVAVSLYDSSGVELAGGVFNLALAPAGGWFNVSLQTPVTFKPGAYFFLEVVASYEINFPAGADKQARTRGKSFYYDAGQGAYVPLGTIPGFENGAFLIRASGTQTAVQNRPPLASARVSPAAPTVGQAVSFDASGSSDPDGTITTYAWTFGDGQGSNQAVVSHTYAQAGTFPITLTVTDNRGATGVASGQITVTQGGGGCPLAVTPANGTIAAGGSGTLTVTYDAAANAQMGTYSGQISIGGNGGNLSVPVVVTVVVANEAAGAPARVALLPNRPNPFRSETEIAFSLAEAAPVTLSVYDALGRRVREVASGVHAAGSHAVRWDGRDAAGQDLASGLYFIHLELGGSRPTTLTRRIVKTR